MSEPTTCESCIPRGPEHCPRHGTTAPARDIEDAERDCKYLDSQLNRAAHEVASLRTSLAAAEGRLAEVVTEVQQWDRYGKDAADAVRAIAERLGVPVATSPVPETGPRRAFAVVNSSYADDEVHALYNTKALAQAEAKRLGGMWEVAEWVINDAPDSVIPQRQERPDGK